MKKIMTALLSVLLLAACAGEAAVSESTAVAAAEESAEATIETVEETKFTDYEQAVLDKVDSAFMKEVIETISSYGDNQYVGMRSSGSQAEKDTAAYLEGVMKEIGLSNVTVDPFTNDNWSFNKADLYYNDLNGDEQVLHLGGYQTHWVSDNEEVQLVYAGRGTAADYEGLDVEGKVVLIDIDQHNDWWINIPAYQAYVKGAKGIIAYNIDGYDRFDETTIGSQDACGPEYAPALSVNQLQADALKEILDANDNEVTIRLDVESVVTKDGSSQNLWGEIPGKSDEVIYLIAHYDGYYHSVYDDASGVANCLGIMKAMLDSGYTPNKTIRVVFHGAEEWGKADTEFDWATGAYNQIVNVHPEWAEKGLALLNIDGMYPVKEQKTYHIATAFELQDFAAKVSERIFKDTEWTVTVGSPTSAWTEDFSYSQAGIPCIVANTDGIESDLYYQWGYHSTSDSFALGYDWDMSLATAKCFALMAVELDNLPVRPVDFAEFFSSMQEESNADLSLEETIALSEQVNTLIDTLNEDPSYDASLINYDLNRLFKEVHADFVRLDWDDETVFSFVPAQDNIEALSAALDALKQGDGQTAYNEYLWDVDYNWYAYDFDQETFEFCADKVRNKSEGTFGEGLLDEECENLYDVIHSLADKLEAEDTDYTDEIAAVQASLESQTAIYNTRLEEIAEVLPGLNAALQNILDTYGK